jgi:hypothetical protein
MHGGAVCHFKKIGEVVHIHYLNAPGHNKERIHTSLTDFEKLFYDALEF